eukprot:CAMPEP_0114121802 /NCGR_PEP_ID=MMETSP0043_2-20121206/7365_1 /TAXON_ID=464988 /ORGANISM="Hemiselmis andersenii, Strain CCMP644" /LENGTH=81 /DNA_ID=CAMNT_0001214493 /DNA_START=14 /DNA_END=258 /DNA_ORIENTATION=+
MTNKATVRNGLRDFGAIALSAAHMAPVYDKEEELAENLEGGGADEGCGDGMEEPRAREDEEGGQWEGDPERGAGVEDDCAA